MAENIANGRNFGNSMSKLLVTKILERLSSDFHRFYKSVVSREPRGGVGRGGGPSRSQPVGADSSNSIQLDAVFLNSATAL